MLNRLNILFFIYLLSIGACNLRDGVNFSVTNKSSETIHTLTIYVTGNTYQIRNLKSNKTKTVKLSVSGESDVKLKADNHKKFTVEVYLEPNKTGSIAVSITQDTVLTFDKSLY